MDDNLMNRIEMESESEESEESDEEYDMMNNRPFNNMNGLSNM